MYRKRQQLDKVKFGELAKKFMEKFSKLSVIGSFWLAKFTKFHCLWYNYVRILIIDCFVSIQLTIVHIFAIHAYIVMFYANRFYSSDV